MGPIPLANALKLSAWLALHEPGLFRALLKQTQSLQRSPLGRLGLFGDDSMLSEVTIDIPDTSVGSSYDMPDFTNFTPALTDISFDPSSIDVSSSVSDAIANAIAALPGADSSVADASQSSGSFWSSLGSTVASGASVFASSIGKVAGALVSPATIAAAAGLAGTYFSTQAKTAQSQAQQAVVQAQLARVAQGGAPAPISYVRDPVTGQVIPVYNSNSGPQPLTPPLVNRLVNPATGMPTTLIIGGGIAVAILLALYASR